MFSEDTGMEIGIKKCGVLVIKKKKLIKLHGKLMKTTTVEGHG